MADSQNATSTKCFSGIVRRLLCTGSLPTHPTDSDHLPEIEKNKFKFPPRKTQGQAPGTPGVVARLMGLDSMPDVTWVPKVSINNMRSRSVSHVDYFPRFDLMQESQHRRVRTSVSFREIPTSLGPQNQDFFVVCFDKGDENLKMMAKTDHVVGFQEMKKVGRSTKATSGNIGEKIAVKKKENIQQNNKKNDEPKRKSSRSDHVLSHKKLNDVYVRSSSRLKMKSPEEAANIGKDVSARKKHAKKKQIRSRARKGLPECSSVDSSPDSFSSTSGT